MAHETRERRGLAVSHAALVAGMVATFAIVAGPAEAERVGVATAVNPQASGQPPGGPLRLIRVGADMQHEERITTGALGRTQLLFLDGSALTIGPNSDLVLDEFVYDPVSKTGTLAMSATKGLFRFVGGKISKKKGVTIKTPTAIIGIRGGIGIVTVTPPDQASTVPGNGLASGAGGSDPVQLAQAALPTTTARLGFGEMNVSTGAGQRTITRPGFQVVIVNPDLPPPPPVLNQDTGAEQAGLEGSGENAGGPQEQPTNEDVAGTQIADLGSNRAPGGLTGPSQGPGGPAGSPSGDPNAAEKDANPTIAQQNMTLDDTAGVSGGQRTVGTTNTFSYGGRYLSQTPFNGFNFSNNQTTRVATRNQNYHNGAISGGYFTTTLSNGTVMLPAKSGSFTFSSGGTSTPFGAVSGSGFGASDQSFYYWTLTETAHSNNAASLFAGVPFTGTFPTTGVTAYTLTAGFPGDGTLIPSLPASYGGNITGALASNLYVAWHANTTTFPDNGRATSLFGAIAIQGTGSSQRSAMTAFLGTVFGDSHSNNKLIMSGFSRGSVRNSATSTPLRINGGMNATSQDADLNSFFGITGPDHFVLSSDLTTGGTAQVLNGAGFVQSLENLSTPTATFFTESHASSTSAGNVGTTRTSRSMNGFVSGIGAASNSGTVSSAFIVENASRSTSNFSLTTNATTNRASASASLVDFSESQSDITVPFGSLTGSSGSRSTFIDDNTFGLRDSNASNPTVGADSSTTSGRVALLSSAFFNTASDVGSGTSFCSCTYTKWGFISGDVRSSSLSEFQRFHLVPWVAGELGSPTIIAAMTGTATYSGHVVANIMNGSAQYVDTGNLSQSWNFSSQTGSVTISELDGATYTATLAAKSGTNGSQFTGTLNGAGRTGNYYGAFMKAGSNQAGELGSGFNAINSSQQYYVAGIGVAKQN